MDAGGRAKREARAEYAAPAATHYTILNSFFASKYGAPRFALGAPYAVLGDQG